MKGNIWMEIRNERKKGLSYTEIARKHHIDPRTAKNMRNLTPNRYTHLQHPNLQNWILTNT